MKSSIIIGFIGLVVGLFGGYQWSQSNIEQPEPRTITQEINIDSIKAELLKTHVSLQSLDSVRAKFANALTQAYKKNGAYQTEWKKALELIDSMKNAGTPIVDNFRTDTSKTVAIRLVTSLEDTTLTDTTYAQTHVHIEFYGEPLNVFHDLRISSSPVEHQLSYKPKPTIVYEGRGFYYGWDGSWRSGEFGAGMHVGFDNLRFALMGSTDKTVTFHLSVDN